MLLELWLHAWVQPLSAVVRAGPCSTYLYMFRPHARSSHHHTHSSQFPCTLADTEYIH